MRSWCWNAGGRGGELIKFRIEFESKEAGPFDIRVPVREAQLPGFVLAAPEVVASFKSRDVGADYYYDDYAYSRLHFFTGKNYYGPYHRIVTTNSTFSYEIYGGLPKYEPDTDKPGALDHLIVALMQEYEWTVKNWKLTVSSLEDAWNYPPQYIAEGNHQALIEYLELDKISSY